MTQAQGWVLIALIAFTAGWFIQSDLADRPDAVTRALEAHETLMGRGE